MLPEQRRRLDLCRYAVEAHWPGGHCHSAFAMCHRLQNTALPKAWLVGQLHRIEDSTGGDTNRAQLRHRLLLRMATRPAGNDLVHLGLMLQSRVRGFVALVAYQV